MTHVPQTVFVCSVTDKFHFWFLTSYVLMYQKIDDYRSASDAFMSQYYHLTGRL